MEFTRLLVSLLVLAASFFPMTPTVKVAVTQQVVDLINATRTQSGLSSLVVSPELTSSAQDFADRLASDNFFAHVGLDGSTMDRRDESAGYIGWTYLEENLAAGQETAVQAVAAWLASPEHRANLLSTHVQETGVGFAYAPGSRYKFYWVQEFGNRPSTPASNAALDESWISPNGFVVQGPWLAFVRNHGDVDITGLPESNVTVDPSTGQTVQYFQRVILEWHPESVAGNQVERRLLGDLVYPGFDPPLDPADAPPDPATYFPFSPASPTGLGHFVANDTRSGQVTYFKDYFDGHGGVEAFGFPKEEPKLRGGLWTQRFQAAVFEYHPENDRTGFVVGTSIQVRNYRVQLELLTDEYLRLPR